MQAFAKPVILLARPVVPSIFAWNRALYPHANAIVDAKTISVFNPHPASDLRRRFG
jgi:hypothetical protein